MDKDNVALTPPMGWNSWDCYGPAVNEEQLLGNAQYMAGHLKEYGWEYVCCDIQWSEPTAGKVSASCPPWSGSPPPRGARALGPSRRNSTTWG